MCPQAWLDSRMDVGLAARLLQEAQMEHRKKCLGPHKSHQVGHACCRRKGLVPLTVRFGPGVSLCHL